MRVLLCYFSTHEYSSLTLCSISTIRGSFSTSDFRLIISICSLFFSFVFF